MKLKPAVCVAATLIAGIHTFDVSAQTTEAASTTAANELPAADKQFVQAATMANSTEVDASKMATEQSYNSTVKTYARMMLDQHTLMIAQLKMATPSADTSPKDNSDMAVISALKPLRGDAFDKAYMQMIGIRLHEQAIKAFEMEARSGKVDDLKKLAAETIPKLKEHYDQAKALIAGKGPKPILD